MSKKTADLWKRAMEATRDASKVQAELAELNHRLRWDRENLHEDNVTD